jgi:hypothetical protein
MKRWIISLALTVVLVGCGSDAPPPPPPEPAKPVPTVLDDQLKAIERAKEVEAIEAEHKRKLDEQINGGGG